MGNNLSFKPQGSTLVELLIGLVLGFILTAASLQIFLFGKQVYHLQQGLARIQENARIASILLGKAIRSSGHFGCRLLSDQLPLYIHPEVAPALALSNKIKLRGFTSEQLRHFPLLSAKTRKKVVPGNDALWTICVSKFSSLVQAASHEEEYLLVKSDEEFRINQTIVLSDCSQAEMLKVLSAPFPIPHRGLLKIPIAPSHAKRLTKPYVPPAIVGILNVSVFYVGNTFRRNAKGSEILALYSTDFNGRSLELIEGIEHLQLLFGVQQGSTIQYLSADKIDNWQNVKSVKVKLLINSIEEVLIKPQPYQLNGKTVVPTDRLLRKWWNYEWPIKGKV